MELFFKRSGVATALFIGMSMLVACQEQAVVKLSFTSGIRAILEDSKGNIWFGSHQEGVAVFDGQEYTYFTVEDGLSDNQVRSMYEDASGQIWFECGRGLSSYDGQKISTPSAKNYGLRNAWQANPGDLWFKGDEANGYNSNEGQAGVYRYDGREFFYHEFPLKPVSGQAFYHSVSTPFVRGKNDRLWFGTYGAVVGYDGSEFLVLDNAALGLSEATGYLHVRAIFEDSKGNLWIGNNGIGVWVYDGKDATNFTALHRGKMPFMASGGPERVFSIGEDANGNIWFGTIGSGAWFFDGTSLSNYTRKQGLESNHIWTIYRSRQGEMWFGGADPSGVYAFRGGIFKRIF